MSSSPPHTSFPTPPTSAPAEPLRTPSLATAAPASAAESDHDDASDSSSYTATHAAATTSPSQRPQLRSLPPPLNRLALTTSTEGHNPVAAIHRSIRRPPPPVTRPPRGVAAAVLNRLLRSQSPEAPSAGGVHGGEQGMSLSLFPTPPAHKAPRPPSHVLSSSGSVGFTATAAAAAAAATSWGRRRVTTLPLATTGAAQEDKEDRLRFSLPTVESQVRVEAPHTSPDANTSARAGDSVETDGAESPGDGLPWWKRIMIDRDYRHRMMQLSTEVYRSELKLLRDAPERLSGSAGMTRRMVRRERQWWTDDLADEWGPLRCQHAKEEEVPARAESGSATTTRAAAAAAVAKGEVETPPRGAGGEQHRPSLSSSSPPPCDDVEETVVMAQHVVLSLPPHNTLASTFAHQHPRAMVRASELETIRGEALGAMPPVQYTHEVERQVAAVDGHLSRQRRHSRETSHDAKKRLARDIRAGREGVPMQTVITDVVLEETAAGVAQTNTRPMHPLQQKKSGRASPSWSIGGPASDNDTSTEPATSPNLCRLLPPPQQELVHAQHALNMAAINIRSSALVATAVPVQGLPSRLLQRETLQGATSTTLTTAAAAAAAEKPWRVSSTQEDQVQREEAAAACTDGTENLYGLQYVWRLPLPPSGFIRVTPDPRLAMWPDETTQDYGKGQQQQLRKSGGRGSGRQRSARGAVSGGCRSGGSAAVANNKHRREQEMRRLARRVNNRTRKLQWLHEIGRRRACYNDLAMLSDSETSSPNLYDDNANACVPTAATARTTWDPQSPYRFSMNIVRQIERSKHGVAATSTRVGSGTRAFTCSTTLGSHNAEPIYEGALNINIYAQVPARSSLRGNQVRAASLSDRCVSLTQELDEMVSLPSAAARRRASGAPPFPAGPPRRIFLGCYRQSRLLIHYKVYCTALHREARLRDAPVLARLTENHHVDRRDDVEDYSATPTALLRHVPVIPSPILRLQTHAPELQQPASRFVPDDSTIAGARCWEGLFPSSRVDLTSEAHHVWRGLRESALVQQAIRDIFEDLQHDREGQLNKRTYALFVLQLLEIFFPTFLGATAHVAIAEEEWVYRGTTEHVGPRTFHEKFFGFPFIFLRDIAAVTEAALVEFWMLVRLCLRAQQAHAQPHAHEKAAIQAEDLLTGMHLLVPLACLSPEQLRTLVTQPPPPFDPAVYVRFHLLTAAYRSDPVVHKAPRAHQYLVARTRVEQRLQASRVQRQQRQVATANALSRASVATTAAEAAASPEVRMVSPTELLGASTGTVARNGVENVVQREREEHQRSIEAREKRLLLEGSVLYQRRQRVLYERTAAALSGIECATSSWELHRADVYEPPTHSPPPLVGDGERKGGDGRGTMSMSRTAPSTSPGAAVASDSRTRQDEDVEEALLEYLDGVPADVFSGRVSLRERYLLHAGFQQQRLHQSLQWQQQQKQQQQWQQDEQRLHASSLTAAGGKSTVSPPISGAEPEEVAMTQRFPAVMRGHGNNTVEQQSVEAAACGSLPVKRVAAAATSSDIASRHHTVMSTSFASGMYPLRPVPRDISSIVTPSNRRARARILEQHDHDVSEVSGHGRTDSGSSYLRCASDRTTTSTATDSKQQQSPPRRMPSRQPAKIASASFFAARDEHTRRRLSRRHGAPERSSTTSTGSFSPMRAAAGNGTAAAAAAAGSPLRRTTVRMASRGSLKHLPKSAVRRQRSFLHTTTTAAAGPLDVGDYEESEIPILSVSPAPSPRLSHTPSSMTSSPRVVMTRLGPKPVPHEGPPLTQPITTVASLQEREAADESSVTTVASPLPGSDRSLLPTRHLRSRASHASSGVSNKDNGGAGESEQRQRWMKEQEQAQQEAQYRLGAAARSNKVSSHYGERLRAQQQRQRQYQQRFNAGRKPVGPMKR